MFPPYVKEFCTSAASPATNWNAAPATITAPKIAAPATTITGISHTFPAVHSTSSAETAQTSTARPCPIRPTRRSAKRSAATCASTGTGRTSMVSSEPSRIRTPIRSVLPRSRSASPSEAEADPYSRAISGSAKPPSTSTCENMIQIATKSRSVIAAFPNVESRKDVRYVIVDRTHIATINP